MQLVSSCTSSVSGGVFLAALTLINQLQPWKYLLNLLHPTEANVRTITAGFLHKAACSHRTRRLFTDTTHQITSNHTKQTEDYTTLLFYTTNNINSLLLLATTTITSCYLALSTLQR